MDKRNSPLFTVITPIFNKIKMLEEGLKIIKEQSFKDFELILIDDGSSDNSSEYCDYISVNDSRIKVIHQENRGAGHARNIGIEHAKGVYICFFDIDDKVQNNWLQKIYNLIVDDDNPDLLIYSYNEINPKYKTNTAFKFNDIFYKNNDSIKRAYVEELSGIKFNNGFVWNKVYKREFLKKNKIRFPDLRIQQDEVFNHQVYKKVETLLTSSEILYDYYIYDRGNTRNMYIPDRIEIFRYVRNSFLDLAKYWDFKDLAFFNFVHLRFIRNILYNRNPPYSSETLRRFFNRISTDEDILQSINYINLNIFSDLSNLDQVYIKVISNKSQNKFFLIEIILKIKSFLSYLYHSK